MKKRHNRNTNNSLEFSDAPPLTTGVKLGITGALAVVALSLIGIAKHDHDERVKLIDMPERHMAKEWILGKTPKALPGIIIIDPGVNARITPLKSDIEHENKGDSAPDDGEVLVVMNPVIKVEMDGYTGPFDTDDIASWLGYSTLEPGKTIEGFKTMPTSKQVVALANSIDWVANDPALLGNRLHMYSNPKVTDSTPVETVLGEDGHLQFKGSSEPVGHAEYMSREDAALMQKILTPIAPPK